MNDYQNLDSAAWGERLHSVKEKVTKSAALEVAGAVVAVRTHQLEEVRPTTPTARHGRISS